MVVISDEIKARIPDFKLGVIQYNDIVIGDSPQMFKGRFQLFLESLKLDSQSVQDHDSVREWRAIFKTLGIDPSRYRPSSEALLRRAYGGKGIGFVNSAVDINNFFSLEYGIPLGIYNAGNIFGDIEIRLGKANDEYEGLNGRLMNMNGKLLSSDSCGAFGSPIVDSKRTMINDLTSSAVHLVYVRPSMNEDEAKKLVQAIEKMFIQIHGGHSESYIVK
ncbi:phenylalanine--tRNA ligase beta subunit-related protein [Fictibacillus sp. Mic-4]|uniref:B3/B4 domain-containing protein n=1 Tax=Fictibacillus sp. Mic-4 TaxID=3132826 RepID=UPI003CF88FAE